MNMYVWSRPSTFLAVAQAGSVAEARARMLQEIGESGDGSCPERDKARAIILAETPSIWHGVNAEFALTDSAELREADNYREGIEAKLKAAESELERLRNAEVKK